MARFNERKATLYKKCREMERDFNVVMNMKMALGTELYCYQSDSWDDSFLSSPTEVYGPGDIMTHNEMLRARKSSSTPQHSGILPSSDAGHQRKLSTQQSLQLAQHRLVYDEHSRSSTSEPTSEDGHETALERNIQTQNLGTTYIQDIAVLDSHSNTLNTYESQNQHLVPKTVATPSSLFENSPSPPKRTYNSLSDLNTQITSGSPLAFGNGGTLAPSDEMPSKKRRLVKRLVKQESMRNLLSSIPQLVPLPPSLISPLRSTR